MERLTVKWSDKVYDTFDPVDVVDNEYSKANYNKILTKLGEYEDLEEQGRRDSRHTNADRIRNMSDEELVGTLFNSCLEVMHIDECPYADNVGMCKKCIFEWLQSEAE